MKVLSTERLHLRWLDKTDDRFILQLLNDKSFLENIGDRGVRTSADALKYIEKMNAVYEAQGFGFYLVETHAHEKIGISGMILRPGLPDPDIGFAFFPAHHGKGFALESAHAVQELAEKKMMLPRLLSITSPGNQASIKLLQKLGHSFQKMIRLPNDKEDVALYGKEFSA